MCVDALSALDQPTVMESLLSALLQDDLEDNKKNLCNLRLVFKSERTREVINNSFYSTVYKSFQEEETIDELIYGELLSPENLKQLADKVVSNMKLIAKKENRMTALMNKLNKYRITEYFKENENCHASIFQRVILAKMGLFV